MSDKKETLVKLPKMTKKEESDYNLIVGGRMPYAFSKEKRTYILKIMNDTLEQLTELKEKVSKIEITKNGIYLNKLSEDGKHEKWIRIVAYDKECADCDIMLVKTKFKDIGKPLLECLESINGIVWTL